jgi:hypothetical protein
MGTLSSTEGPCTQKYLEDDESQRTRVELLRVKAD